MSDDEVDHAPEYITAHVRDALARDARSSELDVRVTVEGDSVRLDGFAATAAHRDAVSEVAQEVAADFAVHNEMMVGPFPEDGSVEELS